MSFLRPFLPSILIASLAALGLSAAPSSSTDLVTLKIDGRTNATPWVATAGSYVAVTWGATAEGKTDVFVAVSRDRGRTFGKPVQVNTVAGEARLGGELPPRVAIVARQKGDAEVAVLWTTRVQTGETRVTEIKTARSRDGGRTFDAPIALQSSGAVGDRGWPALALDDRGTAHAVWLDHRGLAAAKHEHKAGHAGHEGHAAAADLVAMAHSSGLYYATVADKSPAAEREVTTGVCYCCKTAIATGADGAVFAAWRHVYRGNLRDIAMSTSRDGGQTFSAARRVSEDHWEIQGCPDDGPAMAVDASGTVHLVWPTVVGSAETPEGALFYATTKDGRTFTPRVRIPTLGSPKPMHPQIAIDGTGRVAVAWDEILDGGRVAVARELRPGGGTAAADRPATFGEPVRLASTGAAMYPVLAGSADGFVSVWTSGTGDASVIAVRPLRFAR